MEKVVEREIENLETQERKEIECFNYLCVDDKWILCLGDNMINQAFETEQELLDFVDKKSYELLIRIMCFVFDKLDQLKTTEKQSE